MFLFCSSDITNSDACDVHLINNGVTINSDSTATFEFEGTGPNIAAMHTEFLCRVDNGAPVNCEFCCVIVIATCSGILESDDNLKDRHAFTNP